MVKEKKKTKQGMDKKPGIKVKIRNKWFGLFGFMGFNALRYLSSGNKTDLIWAVWFVWFIYFLVGESW